MTRLLALALLAGPALASAQTLDLIEAYAAALAHDPTFRAAQAARDAGLEDRILGRAQLLPTINASVSTERNRLRANEREVLLGMGQTQSNTSSSTRTQSSTETTEPLFSGASPSTTLRERDIREQSSDSAAFSSQTLSDERILETNRIRSTNATLQLRQPLINFAATAGYRQGNLLTAASQARFRAQQQELMVRVTEAYAQTLFAQENRRLAASQLETLVEQQATNERMLDGGEGTLTDVLETRAKREIAQAQLIEAEDNFIVARNRLQAMTGVKIESLAPLKTDVSSTAASTQSPEDWRMLAMTHNGLLESLRHQVDAASEEAKKAEAGHYPRLDLVASVGRDDLRTTPLTTATVGTSSSREGTSTSSDTSSSDTRTTGSSGNTTTSTSNSVSNSNTSSSSSATSSSTTNNADTSRRSSNNRRIGLELNVPLYAGGAVSARVRQAAARLIQSQAEMDAKVDEVLLELNRQLRLQQSTAQRALALAQAVASSRVAIDATVKSMAAGVRTNLDVLNARERLTAAERELANARYSHLLAYLRLRFNAGVLAEEDLHTVAGR